MLEIALPIVLIALLVTIPIVTRSLAIGAGLAAAGFGLSGGLLQFVGVRGIDFSFQAVQWWLLATLLLLLAIASKLRRRAHAGTTPLSRWPWALAGVSTLIFLGSRSFAPLDPAPLSSVGYVVTRVVAEDNAKWIDASARLVSDAPLNTWSNVGGPVVLLLTLAASILAGLSHMLYGGVNDVALASGSPILAEHLLIIASPFALTPLIARAVRVGNSKRFIPWWSFALGALILWSCVTVLLSVGHITLQYTLLILTLWVGSFFLPQRFTRSLTSAAVATLAMVWFPLGPVSIVVIAVGLFMGIRHLLGSSSRRSGVALTLGFGAIGFLLFEFLQSSLTYSLGLQAQQFKFIGGGGAGSLPAISLPSLPLFDDPGGTERVSLTLLILTAIGVVGVLLITATPNINHRQVFASFSPMILLAGFAATVAVLDFWAVGDGPGYGALKVAFACLIPILVVTLPIALLAFAPNHRGGTILGAGMVGIILVAICLDSLLPRALMQLKPSLWPSVATSPYWGPAEVRRTGTQPLATNPIACVYLPAGASKPSALPKGQTAYSCTRVLNGVAGLGTGAAVLTEWELAEWLQNRSLWDDYHARISALPPDIRARSVILMDEGDNVVGLETLAYLLKRYPPELDGS